VPLGDGSFGLLPEEWLKKYVTLVGVDAGGDPSVPRTQVGLSTSCWLSSLGAFDKRFSGRERLRQFQGAPADPPAGFSRPRPSAKALAGPLSGSAWAAAWATTWVGQDCLRARPAGRPRGCGPPRNAPTPAVVGRGAAVVVFNWKQEAAVSRRSSAS
jgi:hypothetical protein